MDENAFNNIDEAMRNEQGFVSELDPTASSLCDKC